MEKLAGSFIAPSKVIWPILRFFSSFGVFQNFYVPVLATCMCVYKQMVDGWKEEREEAKRDGRKKEREKKERILNVTKQIFSHSRCTTAFLHCPFATV